MKYDIVRKKILNILWSGVQKKRERSYYNQEIIAYSKILTIVIHSTNKKTNL